MNLFHRYYCTNVGQTEGSLRGQMSSLESTIQTYDGYVFTRFLLTINMFSNIANDRRVSEVSNRLRGVETNIVEVLDQIKLLIYLCYLLRRRICVNVLWIIYFRKTFWFRIERN